MTDELWAKISKEGDSLKSIIKKNAENPYSIPHPGEYVSWLAVTYYHCGCFVGSWTPLGYWSPRDS